LRGIGLHLHNSCYLFEMVGLPGTDHMRTIITAVLLAALSSLAMAKDGRPLADRNVIQSLAEWD
jgi:hypothetical protein